MYKTHTDIFIQRFKGKCSILFQRLVTESASRENIRCRVNVFLWIKKKHHTQKNECFKMLPLRLILQQYELWVVPMGKCRIAHLRKVALCCRGVRAYPWTTLLSATHTVEMQSNKNNEQLVLFQHINSSRNAVLACTCRMICDVRLYTL